MPLRKKKNAFSYLLSQNIIRLYYTREKGKEKKDYEDALSPLAVDIHKLHCKYIDRRSDANSTDVTLLFSFSMNHIATCHTSRYPALSRPDIAGNLS